MISTTLVVLIVLPFIPMLLRDREARRIRLRAQQLAPQVREILQRNCYECHGQDPDNIEKGLDVLDHERLFDSDRNYVTPGAPADSRLIQRIADGSMPPEEEETRLPRVSELELSILKDWILGGAPRLPPDDPQNPIPPVVPYSELADKVKQIFQQRCYECHRYDVARGGIKILHHRLLVTVRKVIVPGQPEESELFQLLTTRDPKRVMPQPPAKPLRPEEVEVIRQWILKDAPPFPKSR